MLKNKLSKLSLVVLGVMAIGAGAPAAFAAQNNTHVTPATCNILEVMNLVQTNSGLDFGDVEPAGIAGSVTIPADGSARTFSNLPIINGHDQGHPALYTVSGTDGYAYVVHLSDVNGTQAANTVTLSDTGGHTMTATLSHNHQATALLDDTTGFGVGGTLGVGANQAAGAYTGSFNIVVNYQ